MPARLDVLALVMVEINTFVTSRLIDVVCFLLIMYSSLRVMYTHAPHL